MFNSQIPHNFLTEMIANNTVSSDDPAIDQSNKAYCELLADRLDRLNFNCQLYAVPTHDHDTQPQKWNLSACRAGHKSEQGGLMLSGHSDTVPAELPQWQQDPWQLTQHNDHLYGLGVTDMKGFFAAVITALEQLPQNNHQPISLVITADEETTMAGARALRAEQLCVPQLNIVGEPTSLQPVISHKGYLAYRITLNSKGGHSSLNQQQANCINAMAEIILQLQQLATQLQTMRQDERFSVPVSTLNLGTLNAGDAVNRICASATLELDIRPLPGVESEQIELWLQQAIDTALSCFQVSAQLSPLYPPVNSFSSSACTHSLFNSCQHHHSACADHACADYSYPNYAFANYVTEAPFFEQLGIPSLVMGPGDIRQAHQANESINLIQLTQASKLYYRLLQDYCFQ